MEQLKDEKDPRMEQLENELFFYIRSGDAAKLKTVLEDEEKEALLYPPRFRQSLFRTCTRAVELMTMARFASLQGGGSPEGTHSMLGNYIESLESCHNFMQVSMVLKKCLMEFATLTHGILEYNRSDYSPLVNRCINRILERMPEKMTLTELSEILHVTPKYLSTLFNRDTGMSLTDFMQDIRINEAKYLLSYSDMNYPDISNQLCYGSQSYFNQVFKKKTGLTPREYRVKGKRSKEE